MENLTGVMVPHVDAIYKKQNIFRHVCGVVADPLQIVGDKDKVHGRMNAGVIVLHKADQLLVNGVLQVVNFVIGK